MGSCVGKLESSNSINVRHILCEKRGRVETILEQLANGKKFDAIARELSGDNARKGRSLEWNARGSLIKAFEDAAYALAVSTVGRPVYVNPAAKTGEGSASASLRCAARVMLTPYFLVRYHGEFSQRLLRRLVEG